MDISTTEYLSALPKDALSTLAKAWKSLQNGVLLASAVMLGGMIYISINKDTLIPGINQADSQAQATIADILPLLSIMLGSVIAFFVIVIIANSKVRGKVRKVADENGIPFKGLLKESKKKQKLLKPYL